MALTDESTGIPATMLVGPANVGGYPYPAMGGGNSGGGFGNGWGDGAWIILLIIVLLAANGGWGNNGNNGGGFGGGQPIIVNDGGGSSVQRGFDQAAVMSGISGVQNGVQNLATQLCGCCGDISAQLCNGFAGVNATVNSGVNTIAQQLYTNTIADMERSFAAQTANTQGMTALQSQLAQCCCDNRAGLADLRYTVATEACADRAAVNDALRDVIAANTASTQRILDQLCQDKIDAKNDTIAQLRSELLYARGQASQDVQTAQIRAGQVAEIDAMYNRLRDCPVPTMPVYGSQPIFTCPTTNGCGCGCNNNGGF